MLCSILDYEYQHKPSWHKPLIILRSDCFKKANNQTQNYELGYNLNQDCFLFDWE